MKKIRTCGILLCIFTASAVALAWGQSSQPAAPRTAVLAGGCFWCIQPAFDKAPGVIKTVVGYCGGTAPYPTYKIVSSGSTGEPESIEITYVSAKISDTQVLDILLAQDRSTPNGWPVP